MVDYRLIRANEDDAGTRGVLTSADGEHLCYTLELPWLANQRNVSCIPKGIYGVVQHNGAKYKGVWRLLDVPNRDGILIHAGNTKKDTEGCILVGIGENRFGVTESRKAIEMLRDIIPETFVLEIV